jgi:shikimate kinase
MEDEYPSAASDGSAESVSGEAAALARRMDRPLVLVGMMGVGKTSLGKRLAAALGAPFIDADEEIERAAQMTIPEIFANFGEAYFRDGERRVIARLLGAGEHGGEPGTEDHPVTVKVIATGGGAFCDAETRALILSRGIAVWLDADLDTLVERTARKDNRPLLRQGNPREILARLKAEREPAYGQAPIHVISGKGPHGRTLGRVLEEVARLLDAAGIAPTPEDDS